MQQESFHNADTDTSITDRSLLLKAEFQLYKDFAIYKLTSETASPAVTIGWTGI